MKRICAAAFALLCAAACVAGEAPAKKVNVDKQVREGILRFHKEMRSDDEKVWIAAFDRVMVDKALLEKLFGKDAALVWPDLAKVRAGNRKNAARLKGKLDGDGDVKSVKLINLRKGKLSGFFVLVPIMIPKDVPVYRAVLKCEKGSGEVGSYLLVDGRVRWVPRLEALCFRIKLLKAEASQRKVKFPELSARFLAALRSEKPAEAMACWVSVKEMEAMVVKPPPGMPKLSAEGVKTLLKYFGERDAVIARWFPNLIQALKAKGLDPKDLKYADSAGTVAAQFGIERANWITMTFAHADGATVKVRIDDGMKLKPKDKWRFSDKPLSVTMIKDGKSVSLDLTKR